jgi:hypothetical protein
MGNFVAFLLHLPQYPFMKIHYKVLYLSLGKEKSVMKSTKKLLWTWAFVIIVGLMVTSQVSQAKIKETRILGNKGDRNYPNPYIHYPRGPGYIRMS